jgi:hypothetical protein
MIHDSEGMIKGRYGMAKFYRNASMVILLAFLASGCLAPLSNGFTARSLGAGKIGLDGGMSVLVRQEDSIVLPAFAIAVGLSSDFDLGVQMESASIGVFGKYSFINNKERGFSLAGVLRRPGRGQGPLLMRPETRIFGYNGQNVADRNSSCVNRLKGQSSP